MSSVRMLLIGFVIGFVVGGGAVLAVGAEPSFTIRNGVLKGWAVTTDDEKLVCTDPMIFHPREADRVRVMSPASTDTAAATGLVYTHDIYQRPGSNSMTATAKLFRNGRSQAVRLPREFRFEGDLVRVRRAGRGVLLEPMFANVTEWFAELDRFGPEPFMAGGRRQPRTPKRNLFP